MKNICALDQKQPPARPGRDLPGAGGYALSLAVRKQPGRETGTNARRKCILNRAPRCGRANRETSELAHERTGRQRRPPLRAGGARLNDVQDKSAWLQTRKDRRIHPAGQSGWGLPKTVNHARPRAYQLSSKILPGGRRSGTSGVSALPSAMVLFTYSPQ